MKRRALWVAAGYLVAAAAATCAVIAAYSQLGRPNPLGRLANTITDDQARTYGWQPAVDRDAEIAHIMAARAIAEADARRRSRIYLASEARRCLNTNPA